MQKKRERLDKIMAACRERMQEEVSVLLGKPFTFSEPKTELITKEEFFAEPGGKVVLSHIDLEGDLEGRGCLLVPIRDAIRIGGTLIMLPETELDAVISSEEYTEELQDSYGEIANIICGSLTSTFEEQYPKNFRLVRTEQEVVIPVKVDPEAEEPIPPGTYYLMRSSMVLEGTEMGDLVLLMPAGAFGLVEEDTPSQSEAAAAAGPEVIQRKAAEQPEAPDVIERERVEDSSEQSTPGTAAQNRPQDEEQPAASEVKPTSSKKDLHKQKERIDTLLAVCLERIGEEVGVLLGGTLKVEPEENIFCTKEEFLEQAGGKQVLARMDVRGEAEDEAFLCLALKDAIFLGGTLIMLPDSELEEVVRNEEFGADTEDAYGEIANIIAGVYTTVFEEQHRKKLGFVKTELETIVPVKIDPDSDEVIPAQLYYLQAGRLQYNDQQMGRLQMVFPASLFGIEGLATPADDQNEQVQPASPAQPEPKTETRKTTATSPLKAGEDQVCDILIFTDDDQEAESLAGILQNLGYTPRILHFRDPVGQYLNDAIRIVFLVMREVGEQGFGMAIKLSSQGLRVPLVASAPAWTRTAVLRAVKYGAADILVTPAEAEDVRKKMENNLVRKAA